MRRALIAATLSALAVSVSISTLAFATPSADTVLGANKAATVSGDAWSRKATLKAQLDYKGQGLTGKVSSTEDLANGWFVDSFNIGPASGANGYDGVHAWAKDPSGAITLQDGGEQHSLAINESYRRANLWWRTDRGNAAIVSDGEKTDAGASYDVLTVTPRDGKAFDAWFDAWTHLLSRIVESQGPQTFTTTFTGYAPIDGVLLPHTTHTTNGDVKYDQDVTLVSASFGPAQPQFAYAAPKVTLNDFDIAGANETSIPFRLLNNHIYADVAVNGKAYTFIFDTGGQNILTPKTAAALGLKSEGDMEGNGAGSGHMEVGLTKVRSLALGKATIKDQVFAVVPLDALEEVEGTPMPGMVGFETFRRFITVFDYGDRTLTFIKPSAFDPKNAGVAIPFAFNGNTVEIHAKYNGIAGNFTIDTGSRSSLTLNAPFAAKYNLAGNGNEAVTGWGVGGPTRSIPLRGGTLEIGSETVSGPVVEVARDKGGAFADASLSGNIGAGVLKRYVVTLDYEHSTMYLKPGVAIADLDTFDRSGMWINVDPQGFKIVDVTATGPAEAAGLKVGDIVTSVDGKTASAIHLYDLRRRLRDEAPGSTVTFAVKRGSETKDVKITLRDLI